MEAGMLGTLEALWEIFPLFTNTGWGESANLDFLKKYMGAKFEVRLEPWVSNVNVDEIQSGDFLAISKIRGFETLEKWASGGYAGHSAVCLRDREGKLWVGKSGHEDEEGRNLIALLPWEEWWNYELTKDNTNLHIALLPLHPDLRSKFNATAAWEYAQSMIGKPYGYHNLIFSWIDTIDGNYPPPLDAHLVASIMTVWNQVQPAYAANIWNEALNKRLHTKIKDAYTLNFFENNSTCLPKWCNDPDTLKLPFCQITGKYMELPGYNTMRNHTHIWLKIVHQCPQIT